jgi:hypothetical protein
MRYWPLGTDLGMLKFRVVMPPPAGGQGSDEIQVSTIRVGKEDIPMASKTRPVVLLYLGAQSQILNQTAPLPADGELAALTAAK